MKNRLKGLPVYVNNAWIKILFSCLSLFLWVLPGWGNIYFKHLGKTDGLSQISVMSICQDELGRMWFGTLEGLNCYDGNRMQVFKPSLTNASRLVGNEVNRIVSDKRGNLFIVSDGNLLRYDLYNDRFSSVGLRTSTLFAHEGKVWTASHDTIYQWNNDSCCLVPFYVLPVRQSITTLQVDANNILWVGTYDGLYRVDNLDSASPVCVIPHIRVLSLYRDTRGRLWVATFRKGMYRVENGVSQQLSIQKDFNLSNNDVRCFTEDNSGNIWIGTFNGLNRIAPDGTVSYYKKGLRPGELKHSSIFSLYRDQQGTIWVGTYYGGVHYFNPEADIFHHYSEQSAEGNGLSFPYVGNMVEDKRGDLWICTEGGGLNRLDRHTGMFSHYLVHPTNPQASFYNLKCIAYNPDDDCLYIGTHKQGLFCFDVATKQVKWNSFDAGDVWNKLIYQNGRLYMQSTSGLYVMERGSRQPQKLLPSLSAIHQNGSDILFDTKGYLWVNNMKYLCRFHLDRPQDKQVYHCGEKGLGDYPIQRMIEMPDGTLFVGTSGNGMFYYNEAADVFVPCSSIDIDYCYSMCVLPNGYLAISSDRGLLLYHPQTGERIMVDADSQLHVSSFNDGCGLYVSRDGELFVGGVDGMTSFRMDALFTPPTYNLYFSSLVVNNKTVVVGAPNGILPTVVPLAQRIDLRHNENNISISFTSNDYVYNSGHQVYEYKLEGFNKEWTVTYGKTIVFTNLNPGRYRLIVREQPHSSKAVVPAIMLPIIIHCAWWETWWAFLIYLACITVVLLVVHKNWRARMVLRAQLAEEKMAKEKNEELIQAKLQFFANVSHEFRTPLTLIISQLESLLQTSSLSPFLRMRLQKIYRNTFHFRELISELLDFRKLERGKLTLHVSQVEMVAYLRQIYQDFSDQAQLQNLHFEFHSDVDVLPCWCDARQLRKVFTNLLSNAFKYTPEGGKVEMQISQTVDSIRVRVIDSGKGIPEESLPLIFERFYQSDPSVSSPSSGIGLALAKGLVELHHGRIGAQSAMDYGSIFTVELPRENPFTNDAEVVMEETSSAVNQAVLPVVQPDVPQAESAGGEVTQPAEAAVAVEDRGDESREKECVLVVEDNEDLLQILTALLSPLYRVCIAMNGQEGLEKAKEVAPDLILSDVMMPVMDGITMCRQIKKTFEICHIPVILLTALTSDNSKIEGLQCGADDYIEKPFSNKLLMGHIANMLRNRRLLKQKFGRQMEEEKGTGESNLNALALTPMDADFLRKLEEAVRAHLADTDFDVNQLARELALSRSSLYNKLKALSAVSPNEYILDVRLRQAADWLKNRPEMQITDIALQAGFNSLRYFRHCFKARYDQTPQEYRSGAK